MNTQHLEEMGCKFGEALAKLKARHMMRSLPLQGSMAAAVTVSGDNFLPQTSSFVDEDFAVYVSHHDFCLLSSVELLATRVLSVATVFRNI